MIKVTALIEETSSRPDLTAEHGLSLYIETDCHKILFDTGASGNFADNARKLGIDLSRVDVAFLSHGHYDHGGGLKKFLEINDKAKIYVNENVFGDYWAADGRYVGIDASLAQSSRFILAADELKVDDTLELFTYNNNERKFPMGSYGLMKKVDGELAEDDFLHEQYLMICDGDNYALISGCSHKGILNILDWCSRKPDAVIGGFHFMKIPVDEKGREQLCDIAKELCRYPARLLTCHCTGEPQYECLDEFMAGRLERIRTGDTVKLFDD